VTPKSADKLIVFPIALGPFLSVCGCDCVTVWVSGLHECGWFLRLSCELCCWLHRATCQCHL